MICIIQGDVGCVTTKAKKNPFGFKNDVFLSINHLLVDTYILCASVHVFAIVFFQVVMTLQTPITL